MKIVILAVGNIKEKSLQKLIAERLKKLNSNLDVSVVEIREEKDCNKKRGKEIAKILQKEAELILAKVDKYDYVVSLAIEGKFVKNNDIKKIYYDAKTAGMSRLVFVIGSSNGLADSVKARSDKLLSFSRMTFPHQLMRVTLLSTLGEING